MMARTKKLKKAKAGVKCAGCDRKSSAPEVAGECLWYCPPCDRMYWMGMQDGLNSLPPPLAAGTHVTTAVVVEKKKAGREKTQNQEWVNEMRQWEREARRPRCRVGEQAE